MEDVDDDFGDLYADVEVQTSTAINGISNCSRLNIEEDDNNAKCIDSGPNNVDSIGDELIQGENEAKRASSAEVNGEQEMVVDNVSDSEDDLNIVLNDDDNGPGFPAARAVNSRAGGFDEDEDEAGGFEVVAEGNALNKNRKRGDQSLLVDGLEQSPGSLGCRERGNGAKAGYQAHYLQYKYTRPHATACRTDSKADGSAGVASYSSPSVRGDWEDNKCYERIGSSSVVAQSVHNFPLSLPRYKTILNINIDTFERKPWRHPGADITNFFNFNFDEESWKCYCNHVEQLRQQTSLGLRPPISDCSRPKEAYEAGVEYEKGAHEVVPENFAPIGQRGIVSSASEMAYSEMKQYDKRKGRAILVEDSFLERQPSMDVRRPVERDSDVIQIAVQDSMEDSSGSGKEELAHKEGSVHEASENADFDVDDDSEFYVSGSGDELSVESLNVYVERSGGPVPKRCSQLKTAANPMSVDSDNHRSGQISYVDGHRHQKVTVSSSDGDAAAMETLNNTKERVCMGTCNIAPSMVEVESESLLGEQTHNGLSSSHSGSHCEASGDDAHSGPEKLQNHLRMHSPNLVTKLQESVTSDYYHSNDSKSHGGRRKSGDGRYYAKNSPVAQDLKHYSRRLHSVSELRSHSNYGNASPLADADKMYAAYRSSFGRRRHVKRLHGFDSYDREGFSYYKESELSFNYFDEGFSYNQVHTSYSKKPGGKERQSFGDETDRYLSRRWDEGEYLLEQRLSREGDEVMERDGYHYEKGLTLNPLDYKESGRLVSNYSSYSDKERGTRWKRKRDELQFHMRTEDDDFLFDSKYEDDFTQEKYGYFVEERMYFDHDYERHLPSTRRGEKNSGRSDRKCYIPFFDWDNSQFMPNEDEDWRCTDRQSLSSRPCREPHSVGRGHDTISPRNGLDLRLTERHGRHKRQIWMERRKDRDWFDSNLDAVKTEGSVNYPDDQVHFRRRRHYRQPELLHRAEDEYTSRHAEGASFSFEETSGHKRFDAKRKLINDREVEQHRYKRLREGNSGKHMERFSNVVHRINHEQTLLRCRDLGDLQLVVGEGKCSGRCSSAGSIMRNDKHANMEQDIDKKQIISGDYSESQMVRAGQADNPSVGINQNDEKWIDKFPVTLHGEALDMEEGQIITEDENIGTEDVADLSDAKKKRSHNENVTKENKIVEGYDNHRILEMMAKMEKRRERFKEPTTLKKGTDRILQPHVDPGVETAETKQQRPARKRRWGGS